MMIFQFKLLLCYEGVIEKQLQVLKNKENIQMTKTKKYKRNLENNRK